MEQLRILGVGWEEDDLTLGAVKALRSGDRIVLRTGRCGCGQWLKGEGVAFETLDDLFEECEDFDELIDRSAQRILDLAKEAPVVYCVNDLSDKTVLRMIESGVPVRLIPGVSEGGRLIPFSGGDLRIISAADADLFEPDAHVSTLIRELDGPILAGEIKLRLAEKYPEEMDIYICESDGSIRSVPLCDLDRLDSYDHRLCALAPAVSDLNRLERYDMRHLTEIMSRLRDYDGCPWDREQTHESLRSYLVEEAYEAVDAIDRDDTDDLYDELGDVLFQVAFHSEIGRQYGEFDLSDVTTAICRKMIRRHPHVFGDVQAGTAEETEKLWSDIKNRERGSRSVSETLQDVAMSMPALMRAEKVCRRLRKGQKSVPDVHDALEAWQAHPDARTTGRLLMAVADRAQLHGVNSELALNEFIRDYIRRIEEAELAE